MHDLENKIRALRNGVELDGASAVLFKRNDEMEAIDFEVLDIKGLQKTDLGYKQIWAGSEKDLKSEDILIVGKAA